MVGEAPAHNEATGRDLYASLIGWPPVGPPVSACGEAQTRAAGAERAVGRDGASKQPSSLRIFLAGAGRIMHGIDVAGQFKPLCPSLLA